MLTPARTPEDLTPQDLTPQWLALREPADAAARATELLEPLRAALPSGRLVIRDLGCGTGANRRWLAPRLPGPQHWIMHDREAGLLALAGGDEAVVGELADLPALGGTSLVTASALLDVLTAAEVDVIVDACADVRIPALLTLIVAGRVDLDPPGPQDAALGAAFNDHQRRHGRLGPDAAGVAAAAFRRRGYTVRTAASPWRLDGGEPLTDEWLRGWNAAALEQRPGLAPRSPDLRRVFVHHVDLLALPGEPS